MPIWFIAVFPDVINLLNEAESEKYQILYDGVKADIFNPGIDIKNEDKKKLEMYRNIIENYLKKVKPYLEIQ